MFFFVNKSGNMRERNNFEKNEGRKINCINCNFNIADINNYLTYHQVEKITQILLLSLIHI